MGLEPEYVPPSTGELKERQTQVPALRLLLAQRKLYSRAKRWLAIRWIGLAMIGLIAPVVSLLRPDYAVAMGAVAGSWIFVTRTVVSSMQLRETQRAAAVQEQFDRSLFGMPGGTERSAAPSLEDIAALIGSAETVLHDAAAEDLVGDSGWYPIVLTESPERAIAICQRANASYADRLLRTTARLWVSILAVWIVAFIVLAIASGMELSTFLLGIFLPLLPAFLDVSQFVTGIRTAARERADLAHAIEERLSEREVGPGDLLVWQEQLYALRRTTPQVPDLIYRLLRRRNEAAMQSAADTLSGGQQ